MGQDIKLDMEKTYDKLEWILSQNTLLIWVSKTWINWMMQCIMTTFFKVIVNYRLLFQPEQALDKAILSFHNFHNLEIYSLHVCTEKVWDKC